ncbi:MAG: leucine--tRNA ligase [Nitrososphaeraceae archaeon]|nr:leucine--tRNA ligase [Nitrososphaeraceae archaeon]MDW0268905.1 leucine--tRNA ligase [Nitrososphaeraceae archaeon]
MVENSTEKTPNLDFNWKTVEEKWRKRWTEHKIFESECDSNKKKYFLTVAYPYPNSPQHVGHGRTYTLADVHARYKRMKNYNVLFPMGFHYTGTPIVSMSQRIKSSDSELIETFRQIYKIPDEIIASFKEPKKIASYFHEEIKQGMKEMGYSIDWRREFTTIDKGYSKLISWQFRNLRKNGLIVQGSHPVGWCPQDQSPVSQHDTVGDIEPELIEYDLVKFKFEDYIIPTATLRPETVFGVTNLWVNPDIQYVIALINNEKWIITKEASSKLEYLNLSVSVVSEIKGSELVGKFVFNQLMNAHVPVFPASFVDPNNGTGIVMSVPAHAPYDYQAMIDLRKDDDTLKKYGINVDIKPINLIQTDKFPSNNSSPAERILAQYSISNQNDPKLEEATNKLYSEEFHAGKVLPGIDIIGNLSVLKAREIIREKIINEEIATTMYELKNVVKCRCGTPCVVKLLTNQWFINYGDKNWKKLAYELVDNMEILPEEIRQEFKNVIDWLKERACARKSGLGTRLPWDNEWTIESLSDSVIYMAYYPLSKYISNDANLQKSTDKVLADDLNDAFFDYVLLGKNDINVVARDSKISTELLERIKNEFLYFYPVDSRHSGRDLIPNHLTFFIFNHTAIFPKAKWPKQIVVNGSVLMEGKKMSKSLGNIIPLRQAIEEYGADPIRLTMLASSEILQDSDFSFDLVKGIRSKLNDIYRTVIAHKNIFTIAQNSLDHDELEDDWMSSRIQRIVLETTSAIEKFRIREALHNILYLMDNDLQWYQKRKLAKKKSVCNNFLKEFLITRIKLLAPFAPFFSEEVWEIIGKNRFVSFESWPEVNDSKISLNSEDNEKLIQDMIFDIQKITKVTKIVPQKIMIYTASTTKNKLYKKLLDRIQKESTANFGVIMKELVNDDEIKDVVKRSPDLVRKMIEDILSESVDVRERRIKIDSFSEMIPLQDGISLLRNEIGNDKLEVRIYSEEDSDKYDPKQKSRFSRPYKPAIYIE